MKETGTARRIHGQEKEIVNILIDSDLYLDMELAERKDLLHFIEAAYFDCPEK